MTDSPNSSANYESAVNAIEAIVKQPTVELKVDFGITKVLSVLTMAWWFTGIAIAPWFWWKLAACIPPVGMIIAVDRALTVYAPEVMDPAVETPKLQPIVPTK
jgi:fatty acid desaturase